MHDPLRSWRFWLLALGVCALRALSGPEPASDPSQSLAYIDPGTNNFLLQLLLTALGAAALTFRAWRDRLRAFVRGKSKQRAAPDEPEPDDDEATPP